MPESIDWLPDGTPYSPRFGDRYHSELGGLDQARHGFLAGCGLPAAWAGAPQWRILETGFGLGLNFLVTWAAWKTDPQRPRVLHFVSVEAYPISAADLLRGLPPDEALRPLAEQLAAQWWGLLPGVHRLSFEDGQVLLTLYIGDAQAMLRKQQLTVDSIYLDGFSPQQNPELWSPETLKSVARHCRRGTTLSTWCVAGSVRESLTQLGFEVHKVNGIPPKRHNLQARFNPRWEPRHKDDGMPQPVAAPGRCLVLGAGLAGASAAASLARRGWHVTVMDAGATPASGASGLPAGLFCPHVSPDDSVLSRLSRSGVRTSLQVLRQLTQAQKLQTGTDWQATGVLEHDLNEPSHLPPQWLEQKTGTETGAKAEAEPQISDGLQWSQPAAPQHLTAAQLPLDSHAIWHEQAGWVRPAQLVKALLNTPGVHWQAHANVARLQQVQEGGTAIWQALDADGHVLNTAEMLVLALGPATAPLLQASGLAAGQWELQAIRGQVSHAHHDAASQAAMPPFPVNGHGNLVPDFPGAGDDINAISNAAGSTAPGLPHQWIMGSTFERDVTALPPTPEEQQLAHASNGEKLAALLPACRAALSSFFDAPQAAQTWSRVRCAAYDRIPVVGPVGSSAQEAAGLWVLTGMGSRGLTLSMLCGELLAAQLHGEPLPLDAKLAQALGTQRMQIRNARASANAMTNAMTNAKTKVND